MKSKAALIIGLVLILSFSSVYAWSSKNTFAIAKSRPVTVFNFNKNMFPPRIPREPIQVSFGICFETDNGADYNHAGTTYYFPRPSNWCRTQIDGALEQCRIMPIGNCLQYIPEECRPASIGDRCLNGTVLIEAYCSWDRISQSRHRCPNGCSLGACY